MKEIRKMDRDDLRQLCILKEWYTKGTCQEYEKLLSMTECKNITTHKIQLMAENIKAHSDTEYEITSIMFEIARHCIVFFEES